MSSRYKRKRASPTAQALAVYRPYKSPYKRARRSGTFTAGKDRVGGYYGRYSGRNQELKFHDLDLDDAAVSAGGTVTDSLNKIAQGVTESTRVGRKCTIRSIQWLYQIFLPEQDASATPSPGDTCRVILFLDKQCNGAIATVLDILETADHQSFMNLANSARFSILSDKIHTINYRGLGSDNAAVVSQAAVISNYQYSMKCHIPIEYNNASSDGSLPTIRSNNIGVLLISSTATCVFASQFRLRFSDQ